MFKFSIKRKICWLNYFKFIKKDVLNNFAKFTGKHPYFCEIFKNTIFIEHLL